jgi:hypothetical protein
MTSSWITTLGFAGALFDDQLSDTGGSDHPDQGHRNSFGADVCPDPANAAGDACKNECLQPSGMGALEIVRWTTLERAGTVHDRVDPCEKACPIDDANGAYR